MPSPLQNVVLDADVPLLRFVTGRFPVTPVVSGKPVAFVSVPLDGVPNTPPFTNGDPAVPTLTASALATPVPKPEIPVETGKPVAFVNVTLVGVPKMGVTRVGLVDNTLLPEPVLLVTPVPPLATASVPATVTAPDVAVLGVRPVDPNEIVVTPAAAAAPHAGTPPEIVRT